MTVKITAPEKVKLEAELTEENLRKLTTLFGAIAGSDQLLGDLYYAFANALEGMSENYREYGTTGYTLNGYTAHMGIADSPKLIPEFRSLRIEKDGDASSY